VVCNGGEGTWVQKTVCGWWEGGGVTGSHANSAASPVRMQQRCQPCKCSSSADAAKATRTSSAKPKSVA
jgi:hypothetical protein